MVNDMSRTRKLFDILFLITSLLLLYLFITNYNTIVNKIDRWIDKLSGLEVIIPIEQTKNVRNYNYISLKETDNFEPKNIEEIKAIYYTVLNKGWDEFTFYCRKDYETCLDDVRSVADDSAYVSMLNNYVSPYNSFDKYNTLVLQEKEIYLSIDKTYSQEQIEYLNNHFNKIINDYKIDKNNIKKEDIRKLHQYLIDNITYDVDFDEEKDKISSTAYGAITNKTAICGGYTDAFAIIMDILNIPNFKISSKEHIWNVIYFNNEWLHVDVTWDDDEINKNNNNNFFMINTENLLKKDTKQHNFDKTIYKELK